jgi:hypothetical protein
MATTLRPIITALALFLAPASRASASNEDGPVTYGCDEVVVVGRVKTIAYTDATGEGGLLGRGRYDMRVDIKRVLRGRETRRVVPANAVAHGQMREDIDFWLVLTPATDGGYVIRIGNLARHPYKLAQTCR